MTGSPRQDAISFLQQLAESEPVIILEPVALDKRKLLAEIERTAADCRRCNLVDGRLNVVFGVGNPAARLMFVGEGPGADEDRQGEPFVGKAGQLLNRIIAAMGYKREDVYIANIVKCRPPSNREPSTVEAAACLPYLRRQIEIIAPQVLVALGKTAAVYLLNLNPSTAVKDLRNRILEYNGMPLVATYHPAALLRNPEYKAGAWADMQVAMKLLSGEIQWKSNKEDILSSS